MELIYLSLDSLPSLIWYLDGILSGFLMCLEDIFTDGQFTVNNFTDISTLNI